MTKNRLEAFSDGVIAILITIMVLELKVPHDTSLSALVPMIPIFLSYVMSYVYLGIYWNNHHHLFQAVRTVNGRILWANLHLLFWLSLIPFVTGWMGQNHFTCIPVALYGVILFGAAVAYFLLAHALISNHGKDSAIARALGADVKGKVSIGIYAVAIVSTYWSPALASALYVVVAVMWLVPDTRIEKVLIEG